MRDLNRDFDEIDQRLDSLINRLERFAETIGSLRREILLWGLGVIAGLVGVIAAIFINGSPA